MNTKALLVIDVQKDVVANPLRTPEVVAKNKASYTGIFLADSLKG
jgi:nicotinamidase-related amidase